MTNRLEIRNDRSIPILDGVLYHSEPIGEVIITHTAEAGTWDVMSRTGEMVVVLHVPHRLPIDLLTKVLKTIRKHQWLQSNDKDYCHEDRVS